VIGAGRVCPSTVGPACSKPRGSLRLGAFLATESIPRWGASSSWGSASPGGDRVRAITASLCTMSASDPVRPRVRRPGPTIVRKNPRRRLPHERDGRPPIALTLAH